MKHYLFIFFILSLPCYAQPELPDPQAFIEDLIGIPDEDVNYEDLYENYLLLLASPLDLNKTTESELRALAFLTEIQVASFFNYRKNSGPFLSIYELQAIPTFDPATIEKLQYFVSVTDPAQQLDRKLFRRLVGNNSAYLVTRVERTLERVKGFSDEVSAEKFQGRPEKLYMRYRNARPNDFSAGFSLEKDPGEAIEWKPHQNIYGPGFISAHLQLINKGKIENVIVGDYQCQFGQGLILGGAFGMGKGAETVNTLRRSNIGLIPFTSVREAGYYRGAATTIRLGRWTKFSSFYSNTLRDANIGDSGAVSSLLTSGLHRNQDEIDKRKRVREQSTGAVLSFNYNHLEAGLLYHRLQYSAPLEPRPDVHNQYAHQGPNLDNAGLFLNYTIYNVSIFAEYGKTLAAGQGFISGLVASLDPKLDVALVYRNYDRNFHSPNSNALAENTIAQNEQGMYWGIKYKMNKKITVSSYADLFRFPWLKFRTYAPSVGHELLVRLSYQPSKKILLYAQAREESKERNSAVEENLYRLSNGVKRNYWLSCDYSVHPMITMKTRLQGSTFLFEGKKTNGNAVVQDIQVEYKKFQFTARHALFATDDFDNRQYVYENDVWLAYSLPLYAEVGVRNYCILQYKINKHFTVWCRYARTRFSNIDVISSDVNEIAGNVRSDVKLQVRITP